MNQEATESASPPAQVSGPDKTEVELIKRASQGSQIAWTQLVQLHQTAVFRLAYLTLADAAEAEDVAQEAFVRAFLKLETFDRERPFLPWILSIANNLARNRRRSLGRYWAAVQRFLQANREEFISAGPGERADGQLLWQAIQKMRPKAREVVYLRYFLELSEAETAAALDIAPGTVKSRLHRALRQLRVVIENDFPELVL